jgi:hypothetical protein
MENLRIADLRPEIWSLDLPNMKQGCLLDYDAGFSILV